MAATENVRQLQQSHNSAARLIVPRHGVATLFGFGIQVRVDRGHLLLEDGIGPNRRCARLPRVGHGLRRLVVVSSDGIVSLAALRWLSDQKLTGQELVARSKLLDATTADTIATFSAELPGAENTASIRLIEAQAASAYWSAWRTLPMTFPKTRR